MLARFWDLLVDVLIKEWMPLVLIYHAFTANLFLNSSATDAKGCERAANHLLIPYQYIFCGKQAVRHPEESSDFLWSFEQRFDYTKGFWVKTASAALLIVPATLAGILVKAVSFLDSSARERYASIKSCFSSTAVRPCFEIYRQLGIDLSKPQEFSPSLSYERRPGDEMHLSEEKIALKEISKLLNRAKIPWWADCGTCLGAYRYGGVIPWDFDLDIAVLLPDFENVRRALNGLNPQKYCVIDFSSRICPNSYLKVYIYSTKSMIDIYHFSIGDDATLSYVFTLESNLFLPEWLKVRERRFTAPCRLETLFPLKKALLDGVEILVPCNPKIYLQRYYGENLSPAKVYDSKTCHYEKDLSHPYWQRVYAH